MQPVYNYAAQAGVVEYDWTLIHNLHHDSASHCLPVNTLEYAAALALPRCIIALKYNIVH